MSQGNFTSVYTAPADLFPPPAGIEAIQIFVGDYTSALDDNVLDQYFIRGILNVAYDVDDTPSRPKTDTKPDPARPWQGKAAAAAAPASRYPEQFAKVGLIDDYGNSPTALLAAVCMAEQLLTFGTVQFSEKPLHPLNYKRGNLLIHCYSGHSRSVTVAALYIYYKFKIELKDPAFTEKSFDDIYVGVASRRGDDMSKKGPEDPPTEGMRAAAAALVDDYAALFPVPTPISRGAR